MPPQRSAVVPPPRDRKRRYRARILYEASYIIVECGLVEGGSQDVWRTASRRSGKTGWKTASIIASTVVRAVVPVEIGYGSWRDMTIGRSWGVFGEGKDWA